MYRLSQFSKITLAFFFVSTIIQKKYEKMLLKEKILSLLEEKKAKDVLVFDSCQIADAVIIASGTSTKNVSSIAEFIAGELKNFIPKVTIEGMREGNWVVVDARSIILHLFHPEYRQHVNLEELLNENTSTSRL